jgi:NADP-dependent 3-hydroxy acid dehydrogenase YdfG
MSEWLNVIRINLGGVSNCCKMVLPSMISAGFGRIYNLGSFADHEPIKNSGAYSCSKGGVHALTKSIARDIEELDLDIEVHEWIPGHLKTRMSNFTGIDPSVSASWGVRIAKGEIRASSKCVLFENDHEWIPPKRLKQRIKEKLLFWRAC